MIFQTRKIPAVSLHWMPVEALHRQPVSQKAWKPEATFFFLTKTPPQLTSWFVMLSCSRLSNVRKSRSLRFWSVQRIFIKKQGFLQFLLPEVPGHSFILQIQLSRWTITFQKILQLLSKNYAANILCLLFQLLIFSFRTAIAL